MDTLISFQYVPLLSAQKTHEKVVYIISTIIISFQLLSVFSVNILTFDWFFVVKVLIDNKDRCLTTEVYDDNRKSLELQLFPQFFLLIDDGSQPCHY